MKNTLCFFRLLFETAIVTFSLFGCALAYSAIWPQEFVTMTPPGAQGITGTFILLTISFAGILAFCTFRFASAIPSIGASLIVAWPLACFAYVDSRTELGVTFLGNSPLLVYRRPLVATCLLIVLFLICSFSPKISQKWRKLSIQST